MGCAHVCIRVHEDARVIMYISASVFMYLMLTLSLLGPDFARKRIGNREQGVEIWGCRNCLPKPIASSYRNAAAGGALINQGREWQLINLSARYRIA